MNFILSAAFRPTSPFDHTLMETKMKLNPYLTFNGNCKQAFEFYAKCLHGEIIMMMNYGDTPMKDDMPAEIQGRVAHARMMIGDQVLMASDAHTECQADTKGMSISLLIDAPAEAERIFKALSEDGQVTMAMAETFWANRFGMLTDKFGIPWMINCEKAAQKAA